MNRHCEIYAQFLEAMGHRVRHTKSTWWFDVHPMIYQNFPFHVPASPSLEEVDAALGTRGLVARYTCRPENGRDSFKIICDKKDYNLSSLKSKARNQTRRGLERCVVRRLEFKELEDIGALTLNRETFIRQGRTIPKGNDDYWRRYYFTAHSVGIAETHGAFVEDKLAAYLIAFTLGDCVNIFIVRSARKFLKANPNNALIYSFTKEAIARPGIREVSFGLETLQSGLASLDHFKEGMGYKKRPIGQKIGLNRWIRPLVNKPVLWIMSKVASPHTNSEKMRKFAGMLEWYATQGMND